MSILNVKIDKPGEVGVYPKLVQIETDNTLAEVMATGYLNKLVDQGFPFDQRQMAMVSTKTTPASTTSAVYIMQVAKSGSNWSLTAPIATEMLQDGSITLAKLATGVKPSHIVKYADQLTTVGGAAAEAFTVTGALATDLAFVQVVDDGTSNVTVLMAVVTADTLTVTFSANPGNDTVINYQLLRAAA